MKRLLLLLLTLTLLCSCGTGLGRYPYVPPLSPASYPSTGISLVLPANADKILSDSMVLLDAKVQDMTDSKVRLKTERVPNLLESYSTAQTGLFLMSGRDMEQLDDRMRFIQMPFLFPDGEKLFALLNSEGGPVRSSPVTAKRLQGEVVGVYYGATTWMISRSKFYDEVGFFNTVGVLEHMAGNDCFGVIGGEAIVQGTHDEIMTAFAEEKVKFCELSFGGNIPAASFNKIKYIEPTNHRYDGWWLVLKNASGELDTSLVNVIREAFSYTVQQQNDLRHEEESIYRDNLTFGSGVEISDESSYQNTLKTARRYYQENWRAVGIPEDIWNSIKSII